ncbi:MAG TPA: nickel pincer cofactor biosynthesis protein LarB [Myxococcales bacterium]|nr:nickel pincer cofactor biosynthesis protein LarB [Myxococcales bacterium]
MNPDRLRTLLARVRAGRVSVSEAMSALADLPFRDLGDAKVDRHRALRQGFPEVVFAPGKTARQLARIAAVIRGDGQPLLVTRLAPEQLPALREVDGGKYEAAARLFRAGRARPQRGASVAILSAGTSDVPVAEEAAWTAWTAGCEVQRHYDVGVAGLQRLLARRRVIEKSRAVVVVAGMEGALASVVGGLSRRPVIAVPTSVGYGVNLGGVTALLGMLNSCAPNVAAVNVDNGFGAGYLAAMIARRQA